MKNLSCNKCGMCCKALSLSKSHEDLKLATINTVDSEYKNQALLLLQILEPISKEEAFKINPRFKLSTVFEQRKNFFRCIKLDSETNLCTIHDNQPKICSSYPFYGREELTDDEFFYSETCGYQKGEDMLIKWANLSENIKNINVQK